MTEKNAYRLINPHVEGSIDTVVRARNLQSAGKKMYAGLSKYFTNHVKDFNMTIQNMETKDLSHFTIDEKINKSVGKNNIYNVDYELYQLDKSFSPELDKKLIASVDKLDKQSGGKRRKHRHDRDSSSSSDDSDLSSSSESDYYRLPILPINKFTYFMLPYYQLNINNLNPLERARLFLPMFSLPINPTLEIRFDLYS